MMILGKNPQCLIKLEGKIMINRVLHRLQASPHKILNNDKGEKSKFTVTGKHDLKRSEVTR